MARPSWSRIRSGVGRAATRLGEKSDEFKAALNRAVIVETVRPYIDALEEQGFSEKEFETCVRQNISFYDSIMAPEWKERLIRLVTDNNIDWRGLLESDEAKRELMLALAQIRDWFPHVIPPAYLDWTLSSLARDIERRG